MQVFNFKNAALILCCLFLSNMSLAVNLDPDLNWCTFLPEREDNEIIDRIFVEEPDYPTARVTDVLLWLAKAASTNKVLMLDARYADCLGCMNRHYNSFIGELRRRNKLIYGVVDFTAISGRQLGETMRRPPYSLIPIERSYKFFQALTFNRTQRYNSDIIIESYPLVKPHLRDHEPMGITEDQQNRIFTRGHFPNLVFIDGSRVEKNVLNRMCFFELYGHEPMSFEEGDDGIHQVCQINHADRLKEVLKDDAVLMQLIGPNLYYTGSETADDFAAPETEESISCILDLHRWGVYGTQQCKKFVRPNFPY